VKDVRIGFGLAGGSDNSVFRRHLGTFKSLESFDPDVYGAHFHVNSVILNRRWSDGDELPLLEVGCVDLHFVVTQWLSSWFGGTPFLSGDLNASRLLLSLSVSSLTLTELVETLIQDLARFKSSQGKNSDKATGDGSPLPFALPSVTLEVDCGSVQYTLLSGITRNTARALHLYSNGFIVVAQSHYVCNGTSLKLQEDEDLPLKVEFSSMFSSQSVFISSSSGRTFDSNEDPILLSVEPIQILAKGSVLGELKDDRTCEMMLDFHSTIFQVSCSSDAVYVELWHPHVIDTLAQTLQHLPLRSSSPKPQHVARSPMGLEFTVALPRFVLFVTSRNLNPNDSTGLTRGVAVNASGILLQHCSIQHHHIAHFSDKRGSVGAQTRHKLGLFEALIVKAIEMAKGTKAPQQAPTFVCLTIRKISVRSALATPYDADDLSIGEKDSSLQKERFLYISGLRTTCTLCNGHDAHHTSLGDVKVEVSQIEAIWRMSHLYNVLLAGRVWSALLGKRDRSGHATSRASLPFTITVAVGTTQLMGLFPHQPVAIRIDSMVASSSPESVALKLKRGIGWAHLLGSKNRWEQESKERWQEFVFIKSWSASLKPSEPLAVCIDGELGRLHIPSGFILSELILDISVTVKAIKHLLKVCASGYFQPMEAPEPEDPKQVPRIEVALASLFLEADDDPFESQLGANWRHGLRAAAVRSDREETFLAKAASITANAGSESGIGIAEGATREHEFRQGHTVSVQEARYRLDQMHSLDWLLRVRDERNRAATLHTDDASAYSQTNISTFFKDWDAIPHVVSVTPPPDRPLLVRIAMGDVHLSLGPPTFGSQNFGQFLQERGRVPLDTSFSLSVPLHLNLKLSSLQATLRDYPLPLVDIPPSSDEANQGRSFVFDSDVVIAEEMGSAQSVNWVDCHILEDFVISVPKTIMPVKSYANPRIQILAEDPTLFTWGVSYGAAIQDLMRVVDSLSSSPRDSSPSLGFWDKVLLSLS
jgi:hypothetical protein